MAGRVNEEDGGEVEVGFEEGISWLPSHVLDDEVIWQTNHKKCYDVNKKNQQLHRQQFINHPKLPLQPQQQQLPSKYNQKPQSRRRNPNNWVSGGSGMQAIFLDSGKQSCGTGVFLPRRAGTNLPPAKKPACSPVLLPARVVQALNLNVHEIGLQVSRRQDSKNNSKTGDCNLGRNKNGRDASTHCCVVVSQNEIFSPELLLPKEWTY
ncbi:uncharacterized protein LOC126654074 [Mercurialis annua]|uniref:uncharacterized protein LOC126654074 n=1 Tax=Mercurialis annua TaxID=3986 RepID=UPI00215F1922|nr:uncharacterized protein LOC126654074 [Mercurialis annua]